jgi:hypothetical protein
LYRAQFLAVIGLVVSLIVWAVLRYRIEEEWDRQELAALGRRAGETPAASGQPA